MTAQQLINLALMDIGVLASGETPSTDESNDAFSTLNNILDSWSNERFACYNQKVETFSLTSGQAAYTMGSGGTFSASARPVRIKGAHAQYSGFQSGCEVLPMERYQASIVNGQGVTAALPSKLGYDTGASLVNVHVWPTPNVIGATITISSWQPLTAIASLATALSFPVPGYELALRGELAVVLAGMFGRPVPADLAANMQRYKQRIIDANAAAELIQAQKPAQ